jgi:hypothetical protein
MRVNQGFEVGLDFGKMNEPHALLIQIRVSGQVPKITRDRNNQNILAVGICLAKSSHEPARRMSTTA